MKKTHISVFAKGAWLVACLLCSYIIQAQILTHEDSLAAGLNIRGSRATAISGYGEIFYKHDFNNDLGQATLRRNVLFFGHRFNSKITFFSELEIENARIEGNEPRGGISMEQCFLKFDLNRQWYIQAGLFSPRIGIMNENHLPNTFNGNERPMTETMVLPSIWREIGVAVYGRFRSVPGLILSAGIYNGLDAAGFGLEHGIGGGAQGGSLAPARQKAIHASILYYRGNFRFQGSAYMGGSVGLDNKTASLLGLQTGMFGTPVYAYEANVQYQHNGLSVKALVARISIPQASSLNTAYASNTASGILGAYAEVGYDLFHKKYKGDKQLNVFARYEFTDMNHGLPENGIRNPYFTQHHLFAGITFMPIRSIAVKLDYHYISSGAFNTALQVNPPPYQLPFWTQRHNMNLGIAYSF